MFRKIELRIVLMLALPLVALGCGGRLVEFNDSVEGTVTLDNQPLGGVIVQFIPADGDPSAGMVSSQGVTDDQGHFSLICDNKKNGAYVCKHKVVVTRGRAADPRHRGEQTQEPLSKDQRSVPSVYGTMQKSPLDANVSTDKHTGYDFSLSSTK
jgi:hypothetical protein